MTELKTLKDLKVEIIRKEPFALCYSEHELRREAIKWVKVYNNKYGGNESIQEFIKYFFNLTEEDLK